MRKVCLLTPFGVQMVSVSTLLHAMHTLFLECLMEGFRIDLKTFSHGLGYA